MKGFLDYSSKCLGHCNCCSKERDVLVWWNQVGCVGEGERGLRCGWSWDWADGRSCVLIFLTLWECLVLNSSISSLPHCPGPAHLLQVPRSSWLSRCASRSRAVQKFCFLPALMCAECSLGSCASCTTLWMRGAACPSHGMGHECCISQLISGRIRQICLLLY